MDPISLALTGVGLATSLFGANKAKRAQKEAMWKQQQITGIQNQQADFNLGISQKLSKQTQQQEALRKQQLLLETTQARRSVIRQAQLARATAISRAANQGALNSSALGGATASIASTQAEQLGRIVTDTQSGLKNFDINSKILQIQERAAITNTAFNKDVANLGGQVLAAQANVDYGKSLFNTGTSLINNATSYSDTFKSLFPKVSI